MIKWILHRVFNAMSERYDYDTSYLHEITDIWPGAAVRYFGLPMLSQMRGPSAELWAGASLGSVLDGDCGPCAQLVVDNALAAGVPAAALQACVIGDYERAGAVGLGYVFANASINGSNDLQTLRETIVREHGEKALLSAAYAAAVSRSYPVLKRGLGHGQACQQLRIEGKDLRVPREASNQAMH